MRRILLRQSELSLTSAIFCLVWAALAVLTYVWRAVFGPALSVWPLINGVIFLIACVVILAWGRGYPRPVAATVTLGLATLVLISAVVVDEEARVIAVAFFTAPIAVYLVWFFPHWVARLLTYSWYVLYSALAIVALGSTILPALVVLGASVVGVSELVRVALDRLHNLMLTDSLCPVWNRRGFIQLVEGEVTHAGRTAGPLSILFADLDNFKIVNDLQGHAAGDRLLHDFAQQLDLHTRANEPVGRLGGDEFAVLMPGSDAQSALLAGNRLRERITCAQWSLGVAELAEGETVNSFISRADELMRADKLARKAGRPTAVPTSE